MSFIFGIYKSSIFEECIVYKICTKFDTSYYLCDKNDFILFRFLSEKSLIDYIKCDELKELNWTIDTWEITNS